MPTMQRTATIRRQLRGEHLGQRYMSLDIATLGREAIRGMLNPGGKPASELNPLVRSMRPALHDPGGPSSTGNEAVFRS